MSSPDELCAQANTCFTQNQLEEAIRLLEEAVEMDSSHVLAHERLAGLFFISKNYDRAIQYYKRVSVLDRRHSASLVNVGAVQNKMKNYQEAVKTLQQALSRDRRCPEAYYNLGIAQRGLNQFSMAASAYKEAIRLDPQMAEAYSNLGNILLEMKNHSQAILNFRRAIELRPNFQKALDGLRKAEELQYQSKQNRNPFGRLVDMEEVGRRNKTVEKKLILTPQQRFKDRETVHQLAKESQTLAEEYVEHLKNELEEGILEMTRSATEERRGRSWSAHLEQLRDAVSNYQEFIGKMKACTDRLRKHEETLQQ